MQSTSPHQPIPVANVPHQVLRAHPRILVVHGEPAIASLLAASIADRVPHASTELLDPKLACATDLCTLGFSAAVCGPDSDPAHRFDTLARLRAAAQDLPLVAIIPGDHPASVGTAVRSGADAVLLDQSGLPEQLPVVVRALIESRTAHPSHSVNSASDEVERLKEQISRLERLSTIDELTGVLNRRGLEAALAQVLAGRARASHPAEISFLAIDLDNFKPINDRFGHPIGDLVLKGLAEVLRQYCRRDDVAARIGGDEFLAALPGVNNDRSERIATRIQARFRSTVAGVLAGLVDSCSTGPAAPLTVVTRRTRTSPGSSTLHNSDNNQPDLSVGVYTVRAGDNCWPDEAIARADQALCRAKSAGKGRVLSWQPNPEVCVGLRSAA